MKKLFAVIVLFLTSCSSVPLDKCQNKDYLALSNLFEISDDVFVNNNELTPEQIEQLYGFKGKEETTYQVEALYYSQNHDVLFVAYKNIKIIGEKSTQLTAVDLADLENYLLNNIYSGVIVDNPFSMKRPEYSKYLKIIRLYPDSSDTYVSGLNVDGYSSSLPDTGIIDIYHVRKDNLYTSSSSKEPRVNILAHEYGHVFNYYNLHMNGNISASYYMKLRLQEHFNSIYPTGKLPTSANAKGDDYYILPTEIEADDFVELFFKDFNKANYIRQSLKNNPQIRYLSDDLALKEKIYSLYQTTVSYETSLFAKPVVIESTCNTCKITYFNNNFNTKVEKKTIYKQYIIATKAIKHLGVWYYNIILSPLMLSASEANLYEQVGTRQGYVRADYYQEVDKDIYQFIDSDKIINIVCKYTLKCDQSKETGYRVEGGYPFSYFLDLVNNENTLVSYDYLQLKEQLISFNKIYFHLV